jgi:hypothetical protein
VQQSCVLHARMASASIVGTRYGDVTIQGVYSDNVRSHKNKSDDGYTLTFAFDNNSGLMGMLFAKIRETQGDIPTYMLRAGVDVTVASIQVPSSYSVVSRRYQTLSTIVNGKGLNAILSAGTHPVSELAQYNPVFSAVVNVTFKNVHVAGEQCGQINTNGILHGGLYIDEVRQLEVTRWFPDARPGALYATQLVVDGIVDFERNRENMRK